MKTRYRFIHFDPALFGGWDCVNNKTKAPLGYVEYYDAWSQHTFNPYGGRVFSADCLADIARFLTEADAERKQTRIAAEVRERQTAGKEGKA